MAVALKRSGFAVERAQSISRGKRVLPSSVRVQSVGRAGCCRFPAREKRGTAGGKRANIKTAAKQTFLLGGGGHLIGKN